MASQAGQQMIAKHILPDISRSKDNQSMTFGRLIHFRPMFLLWTNQVVSFH